MSWVPDLRCWILAVSLSLVNMSNGWIWITYATISDFSSIFYRSSLAQINWVSLLFGVVISVAGLPLIWFIDRVGIKATLVTAALLNLGCAIMRAISSASFVPPDSRYMILIFGSVLGAISQPLGLFSSTKLASSWFEPKKRTIANTIASMGNPLGVLLGSLLSPLIVSQSSHISTLNYAYLLLPLLTAIIVLVSVFVSPRRHNRSLLEGNVSFVEQVKLCVKNYMFILLNIAFSINIAVFTTYSTLIQQILCPNGYSDTFSGLCGALLLGLGFPGCLFCLWIAKKTEAPTDIVKVFMMLTAVGIIGFSVITLYPSQQVLVALCVCWIGFFGFGCYPLCLELAAETAYPAGEVITTGLLLFLSQVISLVFIPLAQEIASPRLHISSTSVCSVDDIRDYWISNSTIAAIGVVSASVFMIVFNTRYNRTEMEGRKPRHNVNPMLLEVATLT